jgi:hypothetical protein
MEINAIVVERFACSLFFQSPVSGSRFSAEPRRSRGHRHVGKQLTCDSVSGTSIVSHYSGTGRATASDRKHHTSGASSYNRRHERAS